MRFFITFFWPTYLVYLSLNFNIDILYIYSLSVGAITYILRSISTNLSLSRLFTDFLSLFVPFYLVIITVAATFVAIVTAVVTVCVSLSFLRRLYCHCQLNFYRLCHYYYWLISQSLCVTKKTAFIAFHCRGNPFYNFFKFDSQTQSLVPVPSLS